MVLATITDGNQWQFVFPNILSLETFRKKYTYYLFGRDQHTVDLIKYTLDSIKIKYGTIIVDRLPTFHQVFDVPVQETNHSWITNTTLDRFVIPFMTDLEKIIWLDTDTLVISPEIFDIYKTDTSEKGISAAACDTLLHDHIIQFSRASFLLDIAIHNTSTFNAGVVLLDCQKLRDHNLDLFIKEVYERSNGVYVNDEIIFNLYDQNYNALTPRFNCMTHKLFLPKDPIVVHFSGKDFKPWMEHIYKSGSYLKYYKLWEYYIGVAFT